LAHFQLSHIPVDHFDFSGISDIVFWKTSLDFLFAVPGQGVINVFQVATSMLRFVVYAIGIPMAVSKTAHPAATKKTASHAAATKHVQTHNEYPIVLVHGMCGWGRDELFGQKFRYFGGAKGDIQEYLKSQGYETFTASVGPISSNWDRACELYAYLVGGVVDYGAVHSAKYGHARYGRSYPGVVRQVSESNKIHLIGHSMGGPTSRMLVQLLEHGDAEEASFEPGLREAPSSPLFAGGRNWVHSVTSVAGVHNGALTADDVDQFPLFIRDLFIKMAELAGLATTEPIFDFNLQQWGLEREEGQGFGDYIRRALESRVWKTQDACIYDLSTIAAHFQNASLQTSKNVYYSSYAIDGTFAGPQGIHIPQANMNLLLKPSASATGLNQKDLPGGFAAWRPSDGLVSVPSAQFPFGHSHERVNKSEPADWEKGVWYVNPTINGMDHLNIVIPLHETTIEQLNLFYEEIAARIRALPA
jgi:triacylglycerol lipase